MQVHVGTSGWNYGNWVGPFYPEGLAKARWLEHYSSTFETVEVNATFYRSMRPSTFEKWRMATPDGFVWAVKANRYLTHVKRLIEVSDSLIAFLESLEPLGEKLGPVLFQLPPSLAFDQVRVRSFLSLLPEGMRCVIEARNRSWTDEVALDCLKENGIAWCISDTAGRYPYLEALTADFAYIRLHGSRKLYSSCYTDDELQAWAERIRAWEVDSYVYFDNDFMGHAPLNAIRLRELLS